MMGVDGVVKLTKTGSVEHVLHPLRRQHRSRSRGRAPDDEQGYANDPA